MKKILFFALFTLCFNGLQAQIYPKGSVNFSAGYGAVSYGKFFLDLAVSRLDLKNVSTSLTGPIYIKGEYAVADNFTVGLNVNYEKQFYWQRVLFFYCDMGLMKTLPTLK